MENQTPLELLFDKFLKNQCTTAEVHYLMEYFELSDNEHELKLLILQQLKNQAYISAGSDEMSVNAAVKEVHHSLITQIRQDNNTTTFPLRKRLWPQLAAAAILLITVSVGLYFYKSKPDAAKLVQQPAKHDILPGTNKAVLTLADGTRIVLDDANKGLLTKQGGISIRKAADGQLIYDVLASDDTPSGNQVLYNTIETPKGGQYQINLPDGSKVWLNAASALKFPVRFTGNIRDVQLKGEAYFEVASNKKMPFHVNANSMNIEVLGTHFNVMAYDDENNISATLLEGAVKIKSNRENALLKPGQQAVFNKGSGKIKVDEADTEAAVAWKNGYFLFNSENFQSIMRKISRWYNVEIEYTTDMSNKDFSGTISRFENVSEVLKMLELTEAVHFKIIPKGVSGKERRIVVMP